MHDGSCGSTIHETKMINIHIYPMCQYENYMDLFVLAKQFLVRVHKESGCRSEFPFQISP